MGGCSLPQGYMCANAALTSSSSVTLQTLSAVQQQPARCVFGALACCLNYYFTGRTAGRCRNVDTKSIARQPLLPWNPTPWQTRWALERNQAGCCFLGDRWVEKNEWKNQIDGHGGRHWSSSYTYRYNGDLFLRSFELMGSEESETEVSWSCLVCEYMLWVVLRKCGILL